VDLLPQALRATGAALEQSAGARVAAAGHSNLAAALRRRKVASDASMSLQAVLEASVAARFADASSALSVDHDDSLFAEP
jgi:hypothetical protein